MSVPKLRFSEFRVAEEWHKRELGVFITERNQYAKEDFLLFSLTIEDGVTPKTERYERSFLVDNEEDAYKIILKNDFAYNPMNLRFGAIARYAGEVQVALSKYYNIFFCDKTVDSKFCEIYFKSYNMIRLYNNIATGSLIEKRRVHFSEFLKLKIPFPSKAEQHKIAECLSSLDNLIGAESSQLNTLKTHKQGLLQQLFPTDEECTPRTRFEGFEGDWGQKVGGDVFNSISNKNHKSDLPVLAITQEHGAIPRELIDYNVSVTDKSIESYKVVNVGDFIISLRSFQGGIEYSTYNGICSPAYIILKPKLEINKKFFKYYFKTKAYILRLNHKLEGIRDGKMISYKYFSEIYLPFPCLKEQFKISESLSSLDDLISAQTAYLDTLKQQKKGLMQQLFPSSDEAIA